MIHKRASMKIEQTKDELIFRIQATDMPLAYQELIDFLTFQKAKAGSVAKLADVETFVHDIKKGWWKKNRDHLLG